MLDLSGSGGSETRGRQNRRVIVIIGEVTLRVEMKVESVILEGKINVS